MCGIAGWVDWSMDLSNQKETLKNMTDAIVHRGPDAEGFWFSERAALGHRRLIVIDPEGGLQPMLYKEGIATIALTFNGEIYNYQELRIELEEKGHVFQTKSDTEVLLHAYLEWHEDCVQHLNGIFAFGIWDERLQRLMLGRDHLGVKPLFFAQRGDAILFGSELKVLLSHPLVKAEVDTEGLAEIFCLGPMRTPGHAIFKDIHEVRGGHYMLFTSNKTKTIQYWTLKSKTHTDDLDTTVETIRSILQDTVKRQLVADRPVVSMLSGGLDSSGLTSLAGNEFIRNRKTLHTYSLTFTNEEQDFKEDFLRRDRDEPWVKRVAEHVGTKHHSIELGSEKLMKNLLIPMRARDLPGVGELETSLYLLFKEMKKDATVALSGESADEVFSGYPWFHQEQFLNAEIFPWLVNYSSIADILSEDLKAKINPNRYQKQRFQEAVHEIPFLEGENDLQTKQRKMSYMFITRFLPFMLERKDRTSMMTGFEVRVPFCDYRLVEYLWNVPFDMKSIDNIEKGILRRAFQPVLPEDVCYRKKSAYPSTKDDTYLQGISDWMLNVLNDATSPILPLINVEKLRAIAKGKDEVIFGNEARGLIDYLLQLNSWLQEYQIKIV
ncbi:asparagine synthase (glutamine-hydrolyzing) [Bacillus gaemokensis]|uniref:asparagine synthase (glutamine-hydrolyzing) n=1 Tax=Bacillus gaemokensis TaxID=574375 RepID=A0A073KBV6_9BACI|nr:asparagine synthase (glutamine-hydrolyzing) [Bacillus gaemokensis]KEK23991.1 asparagine synthase [Bacillus gaemokensis]KYG27195.1 asparagine synthetase B [Bacillus gaemokensis]